MKTTNITPIKTLSGTDRSTNELIYYPLGEKQIIRAYAVPDNTNNLSFNIARSIQEDNAQIWGNLDPWDQQAWLDFSNAWNYQINPKTRTYTAYSAFLFVNYYRRLAGGFWNVNPPTVKAPRKAECREGWSWIPKMNFAQIRIRYSSLHNEHCRCLVKVAKPIAEGTNLEGVTHYYLASGHDPQSFPVLSGTYGNSIIPITRYEELLQYDMILKVETRIFDEDFFPHPIYHSNVHLGSYGFMYSHGDLNEWFPATSDGAGMNRCNPGQGGFFANDTYNQRALTTYQTQQRLLYRIPYAEGTSVRIFGARVKSGGNNNKITLRFLSFDSTATINEFTEINSWEYDLTYGHQTKYLEMADAFDLQDQLCYMLEIVTSIPDATEITILGWFLNTEGRIY